MSASAKATPKGSRKTRIVTLRLTPEALARFPHTTPRKPSASALSNDLQAAAATPSVVHPAPSPADKSSESNATPVPANNGDTPDPNSLAPPPKVDGRRKRGGGAVAGRKRAPPVIDPNAPPRERGRPGPKKKPRLPDGTIDRSTDPITNKPAGAVPRLGPKANTGAINEKLRQLDRTGKPCRRWERKGLQLKSFTGTTWNMTSWRAPAKTNGVDANGEVKSDSSSDVKMPESSAVASERSQSGVADARERERDVVMGEAGGLESSPAPGATPVAG